MKTAAFRPVFVALLVSLILPALAFAQSADLRATIRAELMKDPRSAQMTPMQIDSMVNVLSQQAQAQGLTSDDITWRPQAADTNAAPKTESDASCAGPRFFCAINAGFGFDGSNTIIPIGLLVTSGLLWFLLYELRHHHRHEAAIARASNPASR